MFENAALNFWGYLIFAFLELQSYWSLLCVSEFEDDDEEEVDDYLSPLFFSFKELYEFEFWLFFSDCYSLDDL